MRAGLLVAATMVALPATAVIGNGRDLDHAIGKALFERAWIPAPASTRSADGLGPAFNARSCAACHPKLGSAPIDSDGFVLRLSDTDGQPDPVYGVQIQTSAAPGHTPEARIEGGQAKDLASGPMQPGLRSGLRRAPALYGVGLLEGVPDEMILERADPDDTNGDGISGRANLLPDGRIGRFGWKAAHPTLRDQVTAAFSFDMGLSSAERPAPEGDCPSASCRAGPHGGTLDEPEMKAEIVTLITTYLAARKPRPATDDPKAEALFAKTGCAACHTPTTGFTDLLLHDMGPDLDGGATEPGVRASEWRTAPLLGRSKERNGEVLLHDGRAKGIAAAIELHGGEGDAARKRFGDLSDADRTRLIRYVEAL